jgi:D-alanyl-D-alanine carboxypeptidase/D-alanyl-D-alanine-endopeptidase (penicillin-binding protein 4)
MKKVIVVTGCWLLVTGLLAQNMNQKLQSAYQQFEADSQLSHAISSLYVVNAKTGEVIFDKNSKMGLAPASTQKIVTAATAFEVLGKNYRYKTEFAIYEGKEKRYDKYDIVSLYIKPSCDPTLGSWRWSYHNEKKVMQRLLDSLKRLHIKTPNEYIIDDNLWEENIPDGWIWQDIGNYYGAGTSGIIWRENQYDIILKSGKKIGDDVEVVGMNPGMHELHLLSRVKSAARGTGDNAYVYLPIGSDYGWVKGTIPIDEEHFTISAAMPSGRAQFIQTLSDSLKIDFRQPLSFAPALDKELYKLPARFTFSELSPSLDSIIYWFLQKSINLYGEALLKTFAYEKKGFGATDSGIVVVKDFWKQKGIDENELNIMDGSGLSPQNRVTTHAQVEVLKFAKKADWFPYFYAALPAYNGMKMKSGSIRDVKGFCGYQKSTDGNEYIFSFLVNNYNGSSAGIVNKMYRVLDVLK